MVDPELWVRSRARRTSRGPPSSASCSRRAASRTAREAGLVGWDVYVPAARAPEARAEIAQYVFENKRPIGQRRVEEVGDGLPGDRVPRDPDCRVLLRARERALVRLVRRGAARRRPRPGGGIVAHGHGPHAALGPRSPRRQPRVRRFLRVLHRPLPRPAESAGSQCSRPQRSRTCSPRCCSSPRTRRWRVDGRVRGARDPDRVHLAARLLRERRGAGGSLRSSRASGCSRSPARRRATDLFAHLAGFVAGLGTGSGSRAGSRCADCARERHSASVPAAALSLVAAWAWALMTAG